jgi:hypothetical protein
MFPGLFSGGGWGSLGRAASSPGLSRRSRQRTHGKARLSEMAGTSPAMTTPRTHFAPVLGGGRAKQPGADGGEWGYALHGYASPELVRRKSRAPPHRPYIFLDLAQLPLIPVPAFAATSSSGNPVLLAPSSALARGRADFKYLGQPQASAASSSSFSLSSPSPAMMASATMPAFWRTAASILLAMSGLSLRNTLAFSRPCPMRWLS